MNTVVKVLGALAVLIVLFWFVARSIIGTLAGPVDAFFTAWSTGNSSVSGQLLSEDFKRNTPFEALQKFMSQQRLDQVIDTSWNSSTIQNQVGTLSGTLRRRDGTVSLASITLLKEAKQWKILHIHLGALAQPQRARQTNPATDSQQTNQGQHNGGQPWTRSSQARPNEAPPETPPAGLSIEGGGH